MKDIYTEIQKKFERGMTFENIKIYISNKYKVSEEKASEWVDFVSNVLC
jgi:uncharacterized OsmC-like protein